MVLQASAAPATDEQKTAEDRAAADAAEEEAVATLRKSQEAAKDRESGEEASSSACWLSNCLFSCSQKYLSLLLAMHGAPNAEKSCVVEVQGSCSVRDVEENLLSFWPG